MSLVNYLKMKGRHKVFDVFQFSPPRGGTVSIAKLLLTETKAMQLEGFKVVGRMAFTARYEKRATGNNWQRIYIE